MSDVKEESECNLCNLELNEEVADYKLGPKIGSGSFGQVVVALEKTTNELCALKMINKDLLNKLNMKKSVYIERDVLIKMSDFPFFIRLIRAFQDDKVLYFSLTYARRGDLWRYIKHLQGFNEETTRFYASETLCALEYLHSQDIIHRDIKPENILLDKSFHIRLCDFGTAKIIVPENENIEKSISFTGTAQFVSPEQIIDKCSTKSSDFWSLGITIYCMVCVDWPFSGKTEFQILERIKKLNYSFPPNFFPLCKELVRSLLIANPIQRLGDHDTGGICEIKSHPFFEGLDWSNILNCPIPKQMLDAKLELLPNIYGETKDDGSEQEIMKKYEIPSKNQICNVVKSEAEEIQETNTGDGSNIPLCEIWYNYIGTTKIIKYGLVFKRKTKKWHRQLKRVLIACEGPRLLYIDAHTNEFKGEIPWDCDLEIFAESFKSFQILTKFRKFYFSDLNDQAHIWIDCIKTLHKKYFISEH